jgi:hypothetical protein
LPDDQETPSIRFALQNRADDRNSQHKQN